MDPIHVVGVVVTMTEGGEIGVGPDQNHRGREGGDTTVTLRGEVVTAATVGMVEIENAVTIITKTINSSTTIIIIIFSKPSSVITLRGANMHPRQQPPLHQQLLQRPHLHNLQHQHQPLQPRLGLRSSKKPPIGAAEVEVEVEVTVVEVEAVAARGNRRRAGKNAGEDGGETAIGDPDHPADLGLDRDRDPDPVPTAGSVAVARPERTKRMTAIERRRRRRRTVVASRHHQHHRPMIPLIGMTPSVISRVGRAPWWPIATASSRTWDLARSGA